MSVCDARVAAFSTPKLQGLTLRVSTYSAGSCRHLSQLSHWIQSGGSRVGSPAGAALIDMCSNAVSRSNSMQPWIQELLSRSPLNCDTFQARFGISKVIARVITHGLRGTLAHTLVQVWVLCCASAACPRACLPTWLLTDRLLTDLRTHSRPALDGGAAQSPLDKQKI